MVETQTMHIEGCSACGGEHSVVVTMYPKDRAVPTINGKTPIGWYLCPFNGELVYVSVEDANHEGTGN
jgi:hypothetical protein